MCASFVDTCRGKLQGIAIRRLSSLNSLFRSRLVKTHSVLKSLRRRHADLLLIEENMDNRPTHY